MFYSTETAMLRVINDALREIDSGHKVVLVLLDLSAAFDTIDHTLLLKRLQHRCGFGRTVLAWFKSSHKQGTINSSEGRGLIP